MAGTRRAWCLALFGIGFAAQLTVVFHARLFDPTPKGETRRIAYSLATKGTFADPYAAPTAYTAHRAPASPFLHSLLDRAFGSGEGGQIAKQVYNSALYATAAALLPVVAAAIGLPWQAGAAAGVLAAIPTGYAEVATDWEGPLVQVLLGLLVWLHASGRATRSLASAAGTGALWGFAMLANPTFVLLLALAALWECFQGHWRQAAALAAVSGALLAPWTIRNYERFGKVFFLRTNLGLELYMSSGDGAGATYAANLARHAQVHPNANAGVARLVAERGELSYYAELQERALAWMRTHPREYLALVAERLRYFLFPDDFAGRRYAYPVWAATVLSFLGLGLMLLRQRRAALVILLAAGLYSSLYILVSSMNWRYRQPTYPLTTLAAGYLLWDGSGGRRARQSGTKAQGEIPQGASGDIPAP